MEKIKIICKKRRKLKLKDQNTIKQKLLIVLFGLITGFISGLFGGGGGMIAVPVLTLLLGKPQKTAHATANLIILPITIVSGLFYGMFGNFDFKVLLPTLVGVLIGGIMGALLLKNLSNKWVKIVFSIVIVCVG